MSAAKLVALAFGADLDTYWNFVSLRDAMAGKTQTPIYTQLGILQGRGNGDLDQFGTITRQEAAVMLARALGYGTLAQSLSGLELPFDDADLRRQG